MRKKILGLILVGMVFFSACGGENEGLVLRSADPCNVWMRSGWQTGPDAVMRPELRDGRASHGLSPAEIIYYSVLENTVAERGILINPVLVLAYLENSSLLSLGKEFGDFELRLLKAVGYGGDSNRYNGFYPQLVASTYQWRAYQERGLSFSQAQELYPAVFLEKSFADVYAICAQTMNEIVGTNCSPYPNGQGYYQDFSGKVTVEDLQTFLERWSSPLQEKELFWQAPEKKSALDYANPATFCQ